jgi:hypothetical protein
MEKKHLQAFLFLFMILCSTIQVGAQEIRAEASSETVLAQEEVNFRKIPAIPAFPYLDGWLGGDGALSVQLSDSRVLWIMSDSYVSHKTKLRKRRKFWTIVNNVVAIADYGDDPASIHYYWQNTRKNHRAFFVPDSGNFRFWPVWAFLREDTVYVLMTEVEDREDAEEDELFSFRHRGISLAVVSGLDLEDPLQWDIELLSYGDLYPGESFMQAGTDDSYLYVFKHTNHESHLTRIPLNSLLQPEDAVQYWSEDGTWKPGSMGEDRELLFTGQANGSLEYYPELGYWLYIYGPNFLSNEIRYRIAKRITGPWSESRVLYQTPEQTPGHPDHDPRHFCYLGRSHYAFYKSASKKLLITYDCGSTEFLHAASSDFIYIPRVVVVDVPEEIK